MNNSHVAKPNLDEPSKDMDSYLREGAQRARSLGNRGALRLDANGLLAQDILDTYWQHGFYVFESVIDDSELDSIEKDFHEIRERLPIASDAHIDRAGRRALTVGCKAPTLFWSKPLGDPFGGTALANGRHPVKMDEPKPASNAPKEIVYLMLGTLQFSEAFLRVYAHPDLLKVAASINGEDFVPFNEALFIKEPGRGASVAWHQDGTTHWDSDAWDPGIHGFNFMAQLYGSTPANGVWVVPGTHKLGKVDIKKMVDEAGSIRLPSAVPLVCAPGDVVVCNRQLLHGSFANTSQDWRVTVNFGFHRRSSVLGVHGGGLHNAPAVYDEERIRLRSRLIGYAIDARRQHFPHETPFEYQPFVTTGENPVWDTNAREDIRDYNLLDLSI